MISLWVVLIMALSAGFAGSAAFWAMVILPRHERFTRRILTDMAVHLTQPRHDSEVLISDIANVPISGPRHGRRDDTKEVTFLLGELGDPHKVDDTAQHI